MHSADFTELMTRRCVTISTPFGVSGQAFPGVTPSFHLSSYQFCKLLFFRDSFQFPFPGLAPDLFSQERVAPPFVSKARKLIPLAQAYSRFGYKKNAVLPTPLAPIIRQ